MSNVNETAAQRAERTGAMMDEWHAAEGDTYQDAPAVEPKSARIALSPVGTNGQVRRDTIIGRGVVRWSVVAISEDGATATLRSFNNYAQVIHRYNVPVSTLKQSSW